MRAATFIFAFTAPLLAASAAINSELSSLVPRATVADGEVLIQARADLNLHLGVINNTVNSLDSLNTEAQKTLVKKNIKFEAATIQSLLYMASGKLKSLSPSNNKSKRDSEYYDQLWAADQTEQMILEIYRTYINVATKLNYPFALDNFQPLVVSFKDFLLGVNTTWPNSFWIFETWFLAKRAIFSNFMHVWLEM